jgi:hypothetical protein
METHYAERSLVARLVKTQHYTDLWELLERRPKLVVFFREIGNHALKDLLFESHFTGERLYEQRQEHHIRKAISFGANPYFPHSVLKEVAAEGDLDLVMFLLDLGVHGLRECDDHREFLLKKLFAKSSGVKWFLGRTPVDEWDTMTCRLFFHHSLCCSGDDGHGGAACLRSLYRSPTLKNAAHNIVQGRPHAMRSNLIWRAVCCRLALPFSLLRPDIYDIFSMRGWSRLSLVYRAACFLAALLPADLSPVLLSYALSPLYLNPRGTP